MSQPVPGVCMRAEGQGRAFALAYPKAVRSCRRTPLGPRPVPPPASAVRTPACLQNPLALCLIDIANQRLTLLLGLVSLLSPFGSCPSLPGPLTESSANPWFRGIVSISHCSCNKDVPLYVEVSGQLTRWRPGAHDFICFRPFLGCDLLQAQLIQNLWNLLELNKTCMEHSAKAHFIPEKLTVRTRNNGRQQ